jgi:hypothetical protein
MSDAELNAEKEELLQYKKENILVFMGFDEAHDDQLKQEMAAIDEQIRDIDQQLGIPHQDRSSVPRQSSHRRDNAPSRWPVAEVSKPIPYKPVFPPEFLAKPMKYMVVLACHGGCDQFEFSSKPKFKTEFDTIFTSELGMPAYVFSGSSYNYCYDLVHPFPSRGQDLVSRLQSKVDSLGPSKKPPRLNFKKQHQFVTDMDIFGEGDYGGLPDDGLFVFDVSNPPQTVDDVKTKDIAPMLLQQMPNTSRPNKDGGYSTCSPSYLYKDKRVKLSDLLERGGVLHQLYQAGLTPENTTVIIVSCRVIMGVHEEDWCALQSPSPGPAPQAQRSPMATATVSVPRAEPYKPTFERMDSSSDDESVSWLSDSSWPYDGGRSKRQSKSKRQIKSKSKRQSKRKRQSKSKSKSKSKRQSKRNK